MGTKPGYDDLRTIGQAQFLHNWKLNIVNFPKLGEWPDPEALNWRCVTSDIPTASVLDADIVIRGHEISFSSGIVKYTRTLTMQFVEDTDGTIKEFIRQWREISGETGTGKGNNKVDNEMSFELVQLNATDQDAWRILIIGAIFNTPGLGGLESGSGATIQQPTLTIKYDIFRDGKAA